MLLEVCTPLRVHPSSPYPHLRFILRLAPPDPCKNGKRASLPLNFSGLFSSSESNTRKRWRRVCTNSCFTLIRALQRGAKDLGVGAFAKGYEQGLVSQCAGKQRNQPPGWSLSGAVGENRLCFLRWGAKGVYVCTCDFSARLYLGAIDYISRAKHAVGNYSC